MEQKCSVSYHSMAISKLATFATGVRDGQFNNPLKFPAPPVSQDNFELHITNYETTYKAYKKGGETQKGPFLIDKEALIGDLDLFAASTDEVAAGNQDLIILGGFKPTKSGDAKTLKPAMPITSLKRGDPTGVIKGDCNKVEHATSYGALLCTKPLSIATLIDDNGQLIIGPNDFISKLDLKKSRKKTFIGLVAGTIYYVYYYASNSAGVSMLSKVESIMCA